HIYLSSSSSSACGNVENPLKLLQTKELFSTGGCGNPVDKNLACGKNGKKSSFLFFPQAKKSSTCGNVENFF
ncbi:MAG: hypothetical protein LC778_21385, partial [Acidobacteria bacterium]|nr:hypothetical protein [Acidobacteriota bacterium]